MDLHERDVGLDHPVSFTQLQVCVRIRKGVRDVTTCFAVPLHEESVQRSQHML